MLRSPAITKWPIGLTGAVLALCFLFFLPAAASAQPGAPLPAGPCDSLQQADFSMIPGAPASIMSTQIISATDTQPEYCEVYGLISSQIQFKLWLPTEGWNERYLQVGCGGYCGSTDPSEQCYTGLTENFAVGFDNSGHLGGAPVGGGDALWGYDNMGLREDFGYRSEHVTAQVAKAVIAAFYAQAPQYSYYFGCSNGGRQALQEAQRWPEDFDGIIAGAPAAIQAPLNGEYEPWNGLANTAADGSLILQQAQFQLLNDAALANCDAADGLEDGQITDPRRCDFDPSVLLCEESALPPAADLGALPSLTDTLPAGALPPLDATAAMTDAATAGLPPLGETTTTTATCLTQTQLDAALKLYSGPVTEDGEALYPGHQAVGSELGWSQFMAGFFPGMPPMASTIGSGYLKYLAFPVSPEPSFTLNDWVFDVAGFDSLREMGEVYNATNPDLSTFQARGGKLILYHGWADPAIAPQGTLAYYQAVLDTMGGLETTQDFARLFMVPGMYHCSGGNAPSSFDLLGPIQAWVEDGVAPDQLIATQYADSGASGGFADPTAGGASQGEVVRTRPLCPFPLEQTYDGSGDIDDAASFTCALPGEAELLSGAYDWVGNDLFAPPSADDTPAAETEVGTAGTVSSSERVNVRQAPNTDAEIAGKLEPRVGVVIVGRTEDGSWLQVLLGGDAGWVAAELIATDGDMTALPVTEP